MKALIFDCFGVLYPDTFWSVVNKFVPDWESRSPYTFHDIVTRVDTGHLTRDDFWDETARECDVTRDQLDTEVNKLGTLDTDLLAYVMELRAKGYKTSLLSNVGHGFIERIFTGIDSAQYFDDMVLSGEVGFVKPQPEIYVLAASRLGITPGECVFIDDRERFCQAAVAAGMQAVIYKSLVQLKMELTPLLN